jgi:hypothetical protein
MRQALLCFCAFAGTMFPQEFRATISGRVIDPQDAGIAGAKIIATQIGTEAKFEAVSAADGLYTIPFVPPGTYRLTSEMAGFKRYLRDNFVVGSNERLAVDIRMEAGAATETISVTSEAPVLQSASASIGQVISSAQIENMPVSGRTPLALAQLAFGVVPSTDPRFTRPFDNADQIIAATALCMGLPLVTADGRIRKWGGVITV